MKLDLGAQGAPEQYHRPTTRPAYLDSGVVLEKRKIYMKASSWEAVQRLCNSYDTSVSKVIENLVLDADFSHASQPD
jgi:hypothetical protein